jgi:hypothetical protein
VAYKANGKHRSADARIERSLLPAFPVADVDFSDTVTVKDEIDSREQRGLQRQP